MTVLHLKVGHDGDVRFDVAPRVRFSGNMYGRHVQYCILEGNN